MRVMIALTVAVAAAVGLALPAQAQSCVQNYTVEGTPMLTAMNFRSWQSFPGVDSRRALTVLRQAMLAEGFNNIQVDTAGGALTALQETSGSGRPQSLRVTARRIGAATRVDAVFMVQQGQMADAGMVRSYLCRVISAASN